jgi:hypothetical protein
MPIPKSWSDVTEVPKPTANYQDIPVQCAPYVTDYVTLMSRVANGNIENKQIQNLEGLKYNKIVNNEA